MQNKQIFSYSRYLCTNRKRTSHNHPTFSPHQPYIHPRSTLVRKIIILSTPSVKMPYKHKRDCPVRDKPGLRYTSNHYHLRQVHHLYGEERKKWLGRARFSISHNSLWFTIWMPDTYSRRNETCSQENLFCTTANNSCAESNSIHGNQIMSGIQFPPQILTFGCGSHTKWENVFCPTNFGKQSYCV